MSCVGAALSHVLGADHPVTCPRTSYALLWLTLARGAFLMRSHGGDRAPSANASHHQSQTLVFSVVWCAPSITSCTRGSNGPQLTAADLKSLTFFSSPLQFFLVVHCQPFPPSIRHRLFTSTYNSALNRFRLLLLPATPSDITFLI
jgi:hypothetical protein